MTGTLFFMVLLLIITLIYKLLNLPIVKGGQSSHLTLTTIYSPEIFVLGAISSCSVSVF